MGASTPREGGARGYNDGVTAPSFTTRPEITGELGVVASTHWLASQSGMAMLERGGNAFDAAAAAGFVLQVVEPHLNGPGGEAPMVVYDAGSDAVHVVAGQGCAPAAATVDHFRGLGLDLIPGTGLLPATVPGAVGAWLLLLGRFGSLSLRDVLEPAIGYAQQGFPALPRVAATLTRMADQFRTHWPTSAQLWPADLAAGERLTNPTLAATYRRLLTEAESTGGDRAAQCEAARRAYYEGFVADAIDAFATSAVMDESASRHAGLLTGADLAGWRAALEPPVTFDYGAYRVAKTGPWGQGPVFCQQLALLAGYDLPAASAAERVHTVVECAKLAFADREAWYGDPRQVDVPLTELLSTGYADERRGLVGDQASAELRAGSPGGRTPRLPTGRDKDNDEEPAWGLGEPTVGPIGQFRGDTCHVDAADRFGNLVSATPSGGWLQSSPAVPGLGFCLGTRAQMFWLEEGLPNTLAPGKRPRTTLSPSLALRDGAPYLAFGTPGGDQQDQWSLLFFLSHVEDGLDLQAAIDAATWHSTHFPSSFYPRDAHPREVVVEATVGEGVLADLRRRGHEVVVAEPWTLGRVSAVSRGRDGFLRSAADPRGQQGYAVGR